MKNGFLLGVAALFTFMLVAHPACAQDDTPPDAGEGFMVSNFLLTPKITVSEEYNDNIYTEKNNKTGDFITRIMPRMRAALQNTDHKFSIDAGAEQVLLADETQQHYTNFRADIEDSYKINATTRVNFDAGYRKYHALPGDDETNPAGDAGEPLPYHKYTANTSLRKDIGAFKLEPRLGYVRYDYDNVRRVNGALIDQRPRDRHDYIIGGRMGYPVDASTEVYTDIEYKPINYALSQVSARDSKGGTYLAGIKFKPTTQLTLETEAGYMNREYDWATYKDIDAFDAGLRLTWKYTDDSRLRFNYGRSIAEVTDTNAGGSVRDDIQIILKHAFTDALTGRLEARYIMSNYQGGNGADSGTSDRKDRNANFGAGLNYALSDRVSLTLDYDYINNNSNKNSADYTQNIAKAGVKIAY